MPPAMSTASRRSAALRVRSSREVGWLGERPRACDRPEVGEAHLELHGPGDVARAAAQSRRRPARRAGRAPVAASRDRVTSVSERLLVTDRLRVAARVRPRARHGSMRARAGARRARRPSARTSVSSAARRGRRSCDRRTGRAVRCVAGPTPQSRRDRQRVQELQLASRPRRRARRRASPDRSRSSRGTSWTATPTDAVSPVSSRTRTPDRARAISGPVPCSRRAPRTSRNASSSDERLDQRRVRRAGSPSPRGSRRRTRPSGARGTRRRDTLAGPGPSASRSGRRTCAPRSSRPRPHRGCRGRRRSPAGRPAIGSSSCSTDAKNASRSTCRIAGSVGLGARRRHVAARDARRAASRRVPQHVVPEPATRLGTPALASHSASGSPHPAGAGLEPAPRTRRWGRTRPRRRCRRGRRPAARPRTRPPGAPRQRMPPAEVERDARHLVERALPPRDAQAGLLLDLAGEPGEQDVVVGVDDATGRAPVGEPAATDVAHEQQPSGASTSAPATATPA